MTDPKSEDGLVKSQQKLLMSHSPKVWRMFCSSHSQSRLISLLLLATETAENVSQCINTADDNFKNSSYTFMTQNLFIF